MADHHRHDEIQGEIIHVYDGIEEADNELPMWWLWTFYGAVIFAIGYWFYYQGFGVGPLPLQAYAEEMQAAAAQGGEVSDELIETLAQDSTAVAAGQATFQAQCAVCHREDGSGNIGPNLTDAYWIHGGSAAEIYATIHDGATANGMPAWGATLGPVASQQAAAFVVSLRGRNLEGKEPQGELYVPGGTDEDAAEDSDTDDEIGEGAEAEEAEEADVEGADEAAPEDSGDGSEAAATPEPEAEEGVEAEEAEEAEDAE